MLNCFRIMKHSDNAASVTSKFPTVVKQVPNNSKSVDTTTTLYDLCDDIRLEIMRHLPIRDQMRLRLVDREFHRLSKIGVSRLKSLKFDGACLERISLSSLRAIFNACATNLETMALWDVSNPGRESKSRVILRVVADYFFPSLAKLEIYTDRIAEDVLTSFLDKNSNLRSLRLYTNLSAPKFPNGVRENLQELAILRCNDETLQSLTGQVPNLKMFETLFNDTKSIANADLFFRCVPNLESLNFPGDLVYEPWTSFWKLTSLVRLQITRVGRSITDEDFRRISICCPRLRMLTFGGPFSISAAGVGALSSLKELRDLRFRCDSFPDDLVGIGRLAACASLEFLLVECDTSSGAVVSLMRSCPRLWFLGLRKIFGVDTPEAVALLLKRLVQVGVGYRRLCISLAKGSGQMETWESDRVKAILGKLREKGLIVKIQGRRG